WQRFEQVARCRHLKWKDQSIGFGQRERALDCSSSCRSIAELDVRPRGEQMSLDNGERINHRGPAFEHFGQGSERRGRVALRQMHYGGGIVDLAAAGSFRRQGGESCARLVEHAQPGFYGDRPATYLR